MWYNVRDDIFGGFMKSILRVISIALLCAVAFGLLSCEKEQVGPKSVDFAYDGMTITLTDDFKQTEEEGFTVCFDSGAVVIFCLKEKFTLKDGLNNMSVEEYTESVREVNSDLDSTDVVSEDGYAYMEYSFNNLILGKTFRYMCTVFKTEDAFWMIQFSCEEFVYEHYKPKFASWAKTVRFS